MPERAAHLWSCDVPSQDEATPGERERGAVPREDKCSAPERKQSPSAVGVPPSELTAPAGSQRPTSGRKPTSSASTIDVHTTTTVWARFDRAGCSPRHDGGEEQRQDPERTQPAHVISRRVTRFVPAAASASV